eukprot:2935290-Pleurochrysis_carterae.AAC.3
MVGVRTTAMCSARHTRRPWHGSGVNARGGGRHAAAVHSRYACECGLRRPHDVIGKRHIRRIISLACAAGGGREGKACNICGGNWHGCASTAMGIELKGKVTRAERFICVRENTPRPSATPLMLLASVTWVRSRRQRKAKVCVCRAGKAEVALASALSDGHKEAIAAAAAAADVAGVEAEFSADAARASWLKCASDPTTTLRHPGAPRERYPVPPPSGFVLFDRAGLVSQRMEAAQQRQPSSCLRMRDGGARAGWSPYAKAKGEGRGVVTRCTSRHRWGQPAPGDGVRALATAQKEAEEGAVGGGGDGPSECASRRASAIAARLLEGPGGTSTSPASRSKSMLKFPCSGTREPRKAATLGGTSRRLGCTPSCAHRARSSRKWPRLHASAMGFAAPETWRTWSCGLEE